MATGVSSQSFFIKHSIDWKMAFEGPGYSYNIDSSYNGETAVGFEWEKARFLGGIETHSAIGYTKAFIEYSKRWQTGRFDFYAGLEGSVIWRTIPKPLHNYPNVVVDVTNASLSLGANFESQLRIVKGIHLSTNINVFTSEGGVSDKMEFFRWDVMAGLVFKIPYPFE